MNTFQLGQMLAAYVLTSEDKLARAFRLGYAKLTDKNEEQLALPPKNDYVALVHFIKRQADSGIDWYVRAKGNRSEMARLLTEIVGWTIDVNSMNRAEKRQKSKKQPI